VLMTKFIFRIVPTFLLLFVLSQGVSYAVTLTKDTIWDGEIKVTEDILVPKGITLTIKQGTRVRVASAESTKTDPEYLSPLTEITIRGLFKVEGTEESPVVFSGEEDKAGSWAGVIIDQGRAAMRFVRIRNAETAIHVLNGSLTMHKGVLRDSRYGLVVQGGQADASLTETQVASNDYGLLVLQGASVTTKSSSIKGNRKKDSFTAQVKEYDPGINLDVSKFVPVGRRYKDEVLRGDVVWQGRIEIGGIIRVPQGSRLIVMPGTIVEFLKRDTDGDGIGENGILIQGRLVAKGTREQPIVFRSAESDKRMGDWDSINIMDSAGAQNLIEYCRIENAYRGLHFHFSNVAVHNSYITNNYRGIQFQESLVDMKGNYLYGNKSGVQGRDSDLMFSNNTLHKNYVGANFFRTTLAANGNSIVGNLKEGWRIREGVSTLQENLIDGNRSGLMLNDMFYGSYSNNSFTNNMETGFALKNADNIEVSGNAITGNGINGLNIQDSRALIKGNQITDNAERGIGVQSFNGLITENNLAHNGLYALDLDGTNDVAAPSNWWGGGDPLKVILDKRIEPLRGKVLYEKPSVNPLPFVWPLKHISTDAYWRGVIKVNNNTTLARGAELWIAPKTTVEFSHGIGLLIKGRMIAIGKPDEKIVFTSQEKKAASDWDEIQLEYATGSVISYCIFEYANWGLHSHFTDLSLSHSYFTNNFGGLRFRSGPVEIKKSIFTNNSIGIRAYLGNAVIKENIITRNETGIFVREKGGGLTIVGNNIFNNSNYNIRVGDFNNEDVSARGNWWGSAEPQTTIFDGRTEPGIGNVLFEPFLDEPIAMDMGKSL
jgi:hypothetical protein